MGKGEKKVIKLKGNGKTISMRREKEIDRHRDKQTDSSKVRKT